MELLREYSKKVVYYTCLLFLPFALTGCGSKETVHMAAPTMTYNVLISAKEKLIIEMDKPTEETWEPLYKFTEENLIRWEQVKELETEDYYIEKIKEDDKEQGMVEYPQLVLKEGKDIFCGTEHINALLKSALMRWDYNILYADRYYISLWYGDKKMGKTGTYVISLQCPVTTSDITFNDHLINVQDDNDYKYAPWSSNGIKLSFDVILEEIEKGSCYLDEAGFILWQENPNAFISSVRRQFEEIETGGYEEAYWARENNDDSKKAYRMYIRDGRVGFYIHPIDVWEASKEIEFYDFPAESIETDRDFRVEVAYDWQKEAPVYHMPYEIYGERYESETYGSFYYPQIKGLDENITSALNAAMKRDLDENLAYMNLDEWNEKMELYGDIEYWQKLPPINNPMVTYQTEKYLCIRQEFITSNAEKLRFAKEWKRYHVYDLETGESLRLKDIINLNEEFVTWLKNEKKVEARRIFPGWTEGMHSINETVEWMLEDLEVYPPEILLNVLVDEEFWLKDDSLYIRIPYYDKSRDGIQYTGGGNAEPNYIDYAEVRIALNDIQRFLKAEPRGEMDKLSKLTDEVYLYEKEVEKKVDRKTGGHVEIHYPQIKSDAKNHKQTNIIIRDVAFSFFDGLEELTYDEAINLIEEEMKDGFLSVMIEYEVLGFTDEYISIIFSVESSNSFSFYRSHYMATIDLNTNQYIHIFDLMDMEELTKILNDNHFEVFIGTHAFLKEKDAHEQEMIDEFIEILENEMDSPDVNQWYGDVMEHTDDNPHYDRFSCQNIGLDEKYLYIRIEYYDALDGYFIFKLPRELIKAITYKDVN